MSRLGSSSFHDYSSRAPHYVWAKPYRGAGWGGQDMLPYELDPEIGLELPRFNPQVGKIFDLRVGDEPPGCDADMVLLAARLGAGSEP